MSTSFKSAMERLKGSIRDVPDFPKKGIVFKDITPILSNGQLFRLAVTIFAERYQRKSVEKIVAIDARMGDPERVVMRVAAGGIVRLAELGKWDVVGADDGVDERPADGALGNRKRGRADVIPEDS